MMVTIEYIGWVTVTTSLVIWAYFAGRWDRRHDREHRR